MNTIPVIDPGLMRQILESLIATHQKTGRQLFVPIFWGPPGVGKTSITKAVASNHGYEVVDVILSGIDEGDIGGIPLRDEDGKTFSRVPLREIARVLENPRTILFLDEISRARTGVLQAVFMILSGASGDLEICGRRLKGIVVAASNLGNEDGTVINSDIADSSLQNKLSHFLVRANKENFLSYLMEGDGSNRIRRLLALFLAENGVAIYKPAEEGTIGPWVSPRSLTRMADTLNEILGDDTSIPAENLGFLNALARSLTGEVGGKFVEWLTANIGRTDGLTEDMAHHRILNGDSVAKESVIKGDAAYRAEVAEKLVSLLEKAQKVEDEGLVAAVEVIASCGKETLKAAFGKIKTNLVIRRAINRLYRMGRLKCLDPILEGQG